MTIITGHSLPTKS